jgi:hypothetical protein
VAFHKSGVASAPRMPAAEFPESEMGVLGNPKIIYLYKRKTVRNGARIKYKLIDVMDYF